MRKIATAVLTVLTAVLLAIGIAACAPEEGGSTVPTGDPVSYTITVKSEGGLSMSDVTVVAEFGGTRIQEGKTNEEGVASLSLAPGEYDLKLEGLQAGYRLTSETVKTSSTQFTQTVTVTSSVIAGAMPQGTHYELGSIVYDFTYTEASTGEQKSLLQLFESKKAVLLNFWYSACQPCASEFPLMQRAYENYKDNGLEIVAINYGFDTMTGVADYKANNNLTFDMTVLPEIDQAFGITNYPYSAMVDRYGRISFLEIGAITDEDIFNELFDRYTSDSYQQEEEGDQALERPNVEAPSVEEVAAAINNTESGFNFGYSWDSGEYTWPWLIGEDEGGKYIYTPIAQKNGAWANIILDLKGVKAGDVIAFDYKMETEPAGDIFHVLLDNAEVFQASGSTDGEWVTCYFYVGMEHEEDHRVVLTYMKDASTRLGEDTVYVKNMRITNEDELKTAGISLELLRQAATVPGETAGTYQEYANVYLASDGYYHVGNREQGADAGFDPYLLADVVNATRFSGADDGIFLPSQIAYQEYYQSLTPTQQSEFNADPNKQVPADQKNRSLIINYPVILDYSQLTNYSDIGLTPVTDELKNVLIAVAADIGNADKTDNDKEWLQFCRYIVTYGKQPEKPMQDPIAGLRDWNAFKVEALGSDNTVTFDVTVTKNVLPRGVRFAFTPEVSGAYEIFSTGKMVGGEEERVDTEAWLFISGTDTMIRENDGDPAVNILEDTKNENFEFVEYLEAGTTYIIRCGLHDTGLVNKTYSVTIRYNPERTEAIVPTAPGDFVMITNAAGQMIGMTVAPYVDFVSEGGLVYAVPKAGDSRSEFNMPHNGKSQVLVQVSGATYFSGTPLYSDSERKGFVQLGGFNFSHDAWVNNAQIPSEMRTEAYYNSMIAVLKEKYPDFEAKDYTAEVTAEITGQVGGYVPEHGLVPATDTLVKFLDILMTVYDWGSMDKFNNEDIGFGWTHLCFYSRDLTGTN